MQYDVGTPAEYLESLDRDWRRDTLLQVRDMIRRAGPELEEGIIYKMLGYGPPDNLLFALNAQKAYVSLYVGDRGKIDPDGSLLAGLDMGKGCIRLKKSTAVADTGLDAFIQRAVALWREGADLGC